MGTHLQIISTIMQQMWLSFLLTRTNFLVGALNLLFFIWSASAWVLVPCDSASASSLLIYSSISCVVLGITINGEIPLSALSYIATGPPRVNFVFTISSIYSLTKNTAVSISTPFVLAQYIIPANNNSWRLSSHSLDIWNFPQVFGMPDSLQTWA